MEAAHGSARQKSPLDTPLFYLLAPFLVLALFAIGLHIVRSHQPPSAEAATYLDKAIEILRADHINSRKADWPRLIAQAHAEIGGARPSADTYGAIDDLIDALGEKHSLLLRADYAKHGSIVDLSGRPTMPTARLLKSGIGLVALPGLDSIATPERTRPYAALLAKDLRLLDRRITCGWIIDLRKDTGGNMWPMLRGLDPLLGEPPFGYFVKPSGQAEPWPSPLSIGDGRSPAAPTARVSLVHGYAPIAILLGPMTASSGEMTTIAFIGRPGVRSFGSETAGFTTGNEPVRLSDGATLVVTGRYVRDRVGKDYSGSIQPDVKVDPDEAETVATAWLARQCSARKAA